MTINKKLLDELLYKRIFQQSNEYDIIRTWNIDKLLKLIGYLT